MADALATAPIHCRKCGTGEESVRAAHFLSNWVYVYFPIVMGLLKTAGESLPPRHDFAVRFVTVLMGSPLLLPEAGDRRRKTEPAIDPAAVAVRSRKKAWTLGQCGGAHRADDGAQNPGSPKSETGRHGSRFVLGSAAPDKDEPREVPR